jgi:glucose-6-phosphate-specific signal transduction histidine kinase
MTLDWIYALVGFLIMFGYLVGIGINKPRGMSMKTWCYGYFGVSVLFDLLVVVALVAAPQFTWLSSLLLGLSAGAATGLAFHVAHHISEEDEHEEGASKQKSMLGF